MTRRFFKPIVFTLIYLGGPGAASPFVFAKAEDIGVPRPSREEVRSQLRGSRRFAGPRAQAPDAFQLKYSLPQDADLSVTLLDVKLMPIRTFQISAGQPGAQAGENSLTVWDGMDSKGQDAPGGDYLAALSFRYPDGQMENKRFRLVKR